jgi:hypothetical protein
MEKYIEHFCKNCARWVDVCVTIYSHDEYSCDETCPECDFELAKGDQYDILDKAINDYVSSKIDSAHDFSKDN